MRAGERLQPMAEGRVRTVIQAGDLQEIVCETKVDLEDIRGGLRDHLERIGIALEGDANGSGEGTTAQEAEDEDSPWEDLWEAAQTNPRLLAILAWAWTHEPGTPVQSLDLSQFAENNGIPSVTASGVGTTMTHHDLLEEVQLFERAGGSPVTWVLKRAPEPP